MLSFFSGSGQVNSTAFDLTLKGLLKKSVPIISVEDLQHQYNQYTILDAREPDEYCVSTLPGAITVGYNNFELVSVQHLDKNKPIVVYCSIGVRSEKIGEQLKAAGFTEVYNLYGGIFEWVNQENPVFMNDLQTSRVHAYSRIWGIWLQKGEKVY